MNTRALVALAFLLLGFLGSAVTGESATPPPEPEKLTALRASWQTANERQMRPVKLACLESLEGLRDQFTREEKLAEATVVRREIELLTDGGEADGKHEAERRQIVRLNTLRFGYDKQVKALHSENREKYLAALESLKARYAKSGDLQAALVVQNEIAGVASSGFHPGRGMAVDLGGGVEMEFVWIPPGTFMMGSPASEKGRGADEGPVRKVTISKGFWMGKYEVTQEEWEAVMGNNPSHFKGGRHPVETVSWNDATAFCRALSQKTGKAVRLPTEAEWEYACRAGTTTVYHSGDDEKDLAKAGWDKGNSGGRTHPVGKKEPNAWGLHDMHGNVWEWCADRDGKYPSGPVTDPTGANTGTCRVFRGGSWCSYAFCCRAAFRNSYYPDGVYNSIGFRVARSSVP